MKLTGFTPVVVGLVLAVLIIAIGNFLFDIPEGWGRGGLFAGAAIVFLVFAFGPGNLWGRSNLNSFALPVLLALHLTLSAWWLVGLAVVALWIWALTRSDEGTGDYGRGIIPALSVALAFVVTVALVAGYGLAHWLG